MYADLQAVQNKAKLLRSSGFYDIDNKDYTGNELTYKVDDNIPTKVLTTFQKHNIKKSFCAHIINQIS